MKSTQFGKWVIGQVLALLILAPHIKTYTSENTRYSIHWRTSDAFVLIICVLLLGTALFVLYRLALLLKNNWAKPLINTGFILTLGLSLIAMVSSNAFSNLGPWKLTITTTLFILSFAATLLTIAGKGTKIAGAAKTFCLIVSPVLPMLFFQLCTYPEFASELEEYPAQRASTFKPASFKPEQQRSGYLFVFDEWSYERTFNDRQLRDDFPNLARLISQADVYHNAHSPHRSTVQSLPRLLFQTDDVCVHADGNMSFRKVTGEVTPIGECNNLFKPMSSAGIETFLAGWALPYRAMFGEELDYCYTSALGSLHENGLSFFERVRRNLKEGILITARLVPKPSCLQWRIGQMESDSPILYSTRRTAALHQTASRIISRPGNVFGVFHYSIPHTPFIYDRNGYNAELPEKYPITDYSSPRTKENRIIRYEGNLRYLDTIIGDLTTKMMDGGTYDNSLIILTSDHSWRIDPDYPKTPAWERLTHVPLIIKRPRQQVGKNIDSLIRTSELYPLIVNTLVKPADPADSVVASR